MVKDQTYFELTFEDVQQLQQLDISSNECEHSAVNNIKKPTFKKIWNTKTEQCQNNILNIFVLTLLVEQLLLNSKAKLTSSSGE